MNVSRVSIVLNKCGHRFENLLLFEIARKVENTCTYTKPPKVMNNTHVDLLKGCQW